jgi:ABC-type bacteriocin/lantibiotic exporter with double-glycine peptidase domain
MASKPPTLRENLDRLGLFLRGERKLLFSILIYAWAVGLFSLIIPLTVQELVNTFAYAVTPVMVVTLVGIMAGILLFVGVFRILQFYGTDLVERRLFVRLSLALAKVVPNFKLKTFRPYLISQFLETVLLMRAFSGIFVDLVNFLVGTIIGMTLLALYHPFFIIFDAILLLSIIIIILLGKGGLRDTINMSQAKYDTFNWFQNIAENLIHLKAINSSPIIQQRADKMAGAYVQARKSRFRALLRQYMGSIVFQVLIHTGLLGTAGWLLSQDQLTLGQLVAAEVVVASLLLNLEAVLKRTYVIFYFFTALHELDHLFSLPQDPPEDGKGISLPQTEKTGIHVQCNRLDWIGRSRSGLESIQFEALPGEKWGIICPTESSRHLISLMLSGLDQDLEGRVRYNGIEVASLATSQICAERSVLFGKDLTLFDGTILDNIIMGRSGIDPQNLVWARQISGLDEALNELPDGMETQVCDQGKDFSPSLQLRILLTRAIVTRPALLILDGGLHEIQSEIRESVLRNLCSPEHPWTLIIVTTDSNIREFTQKNLSLT